MPSFEGLRLSEEQVQLLRNRVKEEGSPVIYFANANNIYSSKSAAKNSLQSLVSKGIIRQKSENEYMITNLPDELYDRWID